MSYVWVMTFVYCLNLNPVKCFTEKDKRLYYYATKEQCQYAGRDYFVKVKCEKVLVIQKDS